MIEVNFVRYFIVIFNPSIENIDCASCTEKLFLLKSVVFCDFLFFFMTALSAFLVLSCMLTRSGPIGVS
jgi:hypothetical protein